MAETASEFARREEWQAISEFLERSLIQPCALVVEGEAGIGKTTFWQAACEHARANGFGVLSARPAAAEAVMAFAVLADLLAGIETDAWANLPEPQRAAMDRITLRSNDDSAAADQRTVSAAFLAVVEGLAEQQKLLLAIDDWQWLDSASAAVFAFAMRRLSRPVGVLATVRTGQTANPAGSFELSKPDATRRIQLPPLRLGVLHGVVSQHLGRSVSRPAMVRIHEVSGGNPFYAIELARALAADTTTPGEIRLSATLSELVRARLAALRADVQHMLLAAACLGKPTVELLAAALAIAPSALNQLLEEAETAGIVTLNGHHLRFSHPLLRSGVDAEATPAHRRDIHRRLAQIVVEPELRARHLALAATHADTTTLHSLDTAAEIARTRGAPSAAAELLKLAIGLGGDTPQRRIMLSACLFNSGGSDRAVDVLNEVLDQPAPARLRAEALNLLAIMSQLEGSLLDGADQLQRALAEAGDDAALRLQILISLSWIEIHIGESDASSRHVNDAVAIASHIGRADLLSQALSMWVLIHVLIGNGVNDSYLRRALELEDRQAALTVMFRPTVHQAMVMSWTGQHDAAHRQFVAIRQSCIERGEESELVFVSFHSVLNEIWRGDFAEASRITEDTVERAQQLDGELPLSAALTVRGLLAAYAGREGDVRRDVGEAIGPMSRSGSLILRSSTVAALGFLEVSLGNYQAAATLFEPMLARLSAAPKATEIYVAGFVPDAVEALIQLGRGSEAEPFIALLEANGLRLDRAWMSAVGARCRGMLEASRGDLVGAGQSVRQAMEHHDRVAMPFERARTLLLLGQLQRRQRRKETSVRTTREALTVFEELGTPLWADRARAELDRSSVGRQRGAGLTPSEQRVAELAASGMTNRDVAATLFISPKTVETKLACIYRKLGIHSRVELARHIRPISS